MKIDLRQPVTDAYGKPYAERDGSITPVRQYFYTALDEPLNENPDGQQKYKVAELIFKLFNAKDAVELEAEEAALLKDRIGSVFIRPVVVKRLWDLLDGKKPAKTLPEEDLKIVKLPRSEDGSKDANQAA